MSLVVFLLEVTDDYAGLEQAVLVVAVQAILATRCPAAHHAHDHLRNAAPDSFFASDSDRFTKVGWLLPSVPTI